MPFLTFYISLLVVTSQVYFFVQGSANYGEYCNETVVCDPEQPFTCRYDSRYGRKTCGCTNDKYFIPETQSCELKKEFGEECGEEIPCQHGLYCSTNPDKATCHCQTNSVGREKTYDPFKSGCGTPPGTACGGSEECVTNAACTTSIIFFNTYKGICTCVNNTRNHNSLCYKIPGEACLTDEFSKEKTPQTCLPGLICQNGKCSCADPDHQVYNDQLLKCQTLIQGPCNSTEDCFDSGAECKPEGDDPFSVCRCKTNFVEVERQCDIPYGGKCNRQKFDRFCDRHLQLHCSDNEICECPHLQLYHSTRSCRGLAGAKCDKDIANFCVEGADCKTFAGTKGKLGICTCATRRGLKVQSDRTCS